jgi:hypothetical protein
MREVGQDLEIELAPDQLAQPHGRAGAALHRGAASARWASLRIDTVPKAQVHAQVARPLDGREIARVVVVVHAFEELAEQAAAPLAAGGDLQLRRLVGAKPISQRRHRAAQRGGHSPAPAMRGHRLGDAAAGAICLRASQAFL